MQNFNSCYNFRIKGVAAVCVCGERNTVNHALICKTGGYVILRHNNTRDLIAESLKLAGCKDVQTEPAMIPLNGENLNPGAKTSDSARLDVSARSFWTPLGKAFTDIRVFHPQAPSNASKSITAMYHHHEQQKKRDYNLRVINVEKGTFTPLVFSTTGGMGQEASSFIKHLSEKTARKTNQRYSEVMSFMRRRIRFEVLRTCLIALRGYRGKTSSNGTPLNELDMGLMPSY